MQKDQKVSLRICDCGVADYQDILALQRELRDKRIRDEIPDTVLIVEHPAVITLGARQSANKLLADADELAEKKIELVQIERGGGATAHNLGQLVFYPVLNLRQRGLGINDYIRELEQIGIELLEKAGLHCQRRKGLPGLWVEERKIASIGVRVSKGVTFHGMAINIENDLGIFDLIIPCGLDGIKMTSLVKEIGTAVSMEQVKKNLTHILEQHLAKEGDVEYIRAPIHL